MLVEELRQSVGCAVRTSLVGCTQGRMSMTGYTLRVGLRACGNPLREPTAHDQAPVGCVRMISAEVKR